jgi:hypothetical protein
MAEEHAALSTPLLADVLNQLDAHDRSVVARHLKDGIAHAQIVVERLGIAETVPPPALRPVEVHLLAVICHFELAAGALGLDPLSPPRARLWWRRWLVWRREG